MCTNQPISRNLPSSIGAFIYRLHEDSLRQKLLTECTSDLDTTGWNPRLISVFAGHTGRFCHVGAQSEAIIQNGWQCPIGQKPFSRDIEKNRKDLVLIAEIRFCSSDQSEVK